MKRLPDRVSQTGIELEDRVRVGDEAVDIWRAHNVLVFPRQ